MSGFENDLQRLTFLKRTIALLSSMVDGGECHSARSKEMKNNAQQVIIEMEANAVKTENSGLHLQRVVKVEQSGTSVFCPECGRELLYVEHDKCTTEGCKNCIF